MNPDMTISRDEGEAIYREERITELIHTEPAVRIAAMLVDTEAQLAETRAGWQRTDSHLPEPGRHVLLMATDRLWNVPEGVPDAHVSATGYLTEVQGQGYWSVFRGRGIIDLSGFDLWMYVPKPPQGREASDDEG